MLGGAFQPSVNIAYSPYVVSPSGGQAFIMWEVINLEISVVPEGQVGLVPETVVIAPGAVLGASVQHLQERVPEPV